MTGPDIEQVLARHRPPGPTNALRTRVLAAASAKIRPEAPLSVVDRIWFSRPWRLGWTAALVALALTQAVVTQTAERHVLQTLHLRPETRATEWAAVAREVGMQSWSRGWLASPSGRDSALRRPEIPDDAY